MNLQERIEYYDKLAGCFPCYRPHPLILVCRTRKSIKDEANVYLKKSLNFDDISSVNLQDGISGIRKAKYQQQELKVITPNGMVVPKNESILEFNLLAKAFYDLIGSYKADGLIHSWNVPPNLRVKTGLIDTVHLKRKNASEHIHSDAWAGEQPNCGTAMLLLEGDVETNGIEFYTPPDDFDESWLATTDAGYLDKEEIIAKYTKLRIKLEVGDLVISDFATLHASMKPVERSRPRISIDSVFAYDCSENASITTWRGLHLRSDQIKSIGRSLMFYTEAKASDWVDSKGGFKQATDIRIVGLPDKYVGPYD